jgi:hypothetical protein
VQEAEVPANFAKRLNGDNGGRLDLYRPNRGLAVEPAGVVREQ